MEDQAFKQFQFHPISPQRLPDLAAFSQCHGKFRYCSCMRWRMTSADFRRSTKEERVSALENLVRTGAPVGILAYHQGEPVAWCSVAPRESYAALERYRALPAHRRRRRRLVRDLFLRRSPLPPPGPDLRAAQGRGRLRPTPTTRPSSKAIPSPPDSPSYTYMGAPETFRRAGFIDVTPAGQARRVMRLTVTTK